MILPALFAIALILISIPMIGLQFAPEDAPDPLPLTLPMIPVWCLMFLGAAVTM